MNIEFATAPGIGRNNCSIYFPEPELIGFTGGCGNGLDGLWGNHMASIVPLNGTGYRIYLTRRIWTTPQITRMEVGFVDTAELSCWPDLSSAFKKLHITGVDRTWSLAQPFVIRREEHFELFCWIHGSGMIRYIKCISKDGQNFTVLNLERPCLYHPADKDVRLDNSADGLLSVNAHLRISNAKSLGRNQPISNDATTVSYDQASRLYVMYSVLLLDAILAPERRVDHDNAPAWLRVIHRRTSRDGIEWSDPEIVLIPDADDPPDLQFYVLQHLKQSTRYCGVAGYYRARAQELDLLPAVSTDGIEWQRSNTPWRFRTPLKIGGDPVRMLFPGGMLDVDGWIWMAATAFNFKHNMSGKLAPVQYRQESFIYRQKSSRWAGLKPENGNGEMITPPMKFGDFKLECEVPQKTRLEILSPFGNKLAVGGRVLEDFRIAFPDEIRNKYYGQWIRLKIMFETPIFNMKSE